MYTFLLFVIFFEARFNFILEVVLSHNPEDTLLKKTNSIISNGRVIMLLGFVTTILLHYSGSSYGFNQTRWGSISRKQEFGRVPLWRLKHMRIIV